MNLLAVEVVDHPVHDAGASIEVYRPPTFSFREEAFSTLMLNARELLLRTRVLKENGNKIKAAEQWEPIARSRRLKRARLRLGAGALRSCGTAAAWWFGKDLSSHYFRYHAASQAPDRVQDSLEAGGPLLIGARYCAVRAL